MITVFKYLDTDSLHSRSECGCLFEWIEFWIESQEIWDRFNGGGWCLALHEDRSHSRCVHARNPLCEAGDPGPIHLQIPVTHLQEILKHES